MGVRPYENAVFLAITLTPLLKHIETLTHNKYAYKDDPWCM